jgi:hypothetical protein
MTPELRMRIDKEARALARRVRKGNEASARHGGRQVDAEQYEGLENELRRQLARRAGDC